LISNILR